MDMVKLSPKDLTPEERAYYREAWGFDPVVVKKDLPPCPHITYYYEATIPLENDPELQTVGVALHARVEVDNDGESHNRIVFTRGDQSIEVECVHTAVHATPSGEIFSLSTDKLQELANST